MVFKFYQIPNLKKKKKLFKIKLPFLKHYQSKSNNRNNNGKNSRKRLGLVVLVLFLLEIPVTNEP